jgi:hypothetical protein
MQGSRPTQLARQRYSKRNCPGPPRLREGVAPAGHQIPDVQGAQRIAEALANWKNGHGFF